MWLLMPAINIFDTTLRDGEQSAGVNLNLMEKVEIAKQLERLGVNIIEAGFPSSSHGDFKSVEMIAKTIKEASITGLARTKKGDIDAAWEALQYGEEPRLHLFIATSPIHMTYKLKASPEEVVETATEAVSYAAKRFSHIQWSAEDASRSDPDFLVNIITRVIDAGATVINLPDTVGYATPEEYGRLFRYIKEHVPNIHKASLSAHCHNDLGMAVANSISAMENGATQLEGTINGIGERAGNAALEEIAVALKIRSDYYPCSTDLTLQEIKRTSDLVSKLTGMRVPGNKAVVGRNAFAHESGIHQDGVLKNASTYEIITPETVGIKSNTLFLGKHSGRHAFKKKVEELGFELNDTKLMKAFQAFKSLTDRKKEVTDEDIFAILTEHQTKTKIPQYELKDLHVQFLTDRVTTATISLIAPGGEFINLKHVGHGSVEAIYETLDHLIQGEIELEDYRLNSIGKGKDALAESFVNLSVNGITASGRGFDQDVLKASAHAYINAVNRVLVSQKLKESKTHI